MTREVRRDTRNPAAVATMIDLIHGFANYLPVETELQKAMEQRLSTVDPERKITRRLIENFSSIPERFKFPVFGKIELGRMRALPEREMAQIFARPSTNTLFFDDVFPPEVPNYPEDTQFTILYTGIYCKDRTGDRVIIGPSDEPYVITVAVSIENGDNVSRSERHPFGDPEQKYEDVDNGEWHRGPIAACWSGTEPELEISLIVVVMENDEGDPDAYRDEIETVVSVAAEIAQSQGVSIPSAVKELAEDLLVWVVDSGDDEIGTITRILPPDEIKIMAARDTLTFHDTRTVIVPTPGGFQYERVEVEDQTDLDYHFVTRHTDRGEYVITFRVEADKDPVFTPAVSVDLDRETFVVRNF